MEFTDRCRYWSVLQLVAIVQFYRGYASGSIKTAHSRAQGCVGSRLDLLCPSFKIIEVTNVHLEVSGCKGIRCCIEDAGCSHKPSEDHVKLIRDKCDGQRNCTIEINFIEATPCESGWGWNKRTIDGHKFERITYSCSVSESRQNEADEKEGLGEDSKGSTESTESKDEDLDKSTSTYGTTATFHSNTESVGRNGTVSDESSSQVPTVVMTIVCLVGLVAIVVLAVYIYRRRKYIQIRLFRSVAMTKVENRQNESEVYANETHGTSQQDCNEDPAVYSQVVKRKSGNKDSQSNPVTSDKGKAATVAHTTGPDVYAVVKKPSKAPTAKSSVLKTDRIGMKDFDNKGDCFTDQIYSLATHDMADIYANESLVESPTRFLTETVSKTSSSQDNEGLTLIENDLYCH